MDDLERRRWKRMLLWLKDQHGMNISETGFHVEVRKVEGAGRGLFATRNCPSGTTLFKVPSTALMNRTTVAKLYPQLRERKLSGTQLISLHLLLHKPSCDDDSSDPTFGPYISTLPRDFSSHPLTWMVKQELKQENSWERRTLTYLPPGSAQKLSALHKRFWTDWKTLSNVLVEDRIIASQSSRLGLLSTTSRVEDNIAVILDYLWAWLNVNTRCIFYRIRANRADPDNFTLCPVLDFANHSEGGTHIFPIIDSELWGAITKKRPKHFIFLGPSRDALSKGQELCLQYGSHSNSFLFSEYGFVNRVPEGAIKSGAYPGQVDVQELVEDLFAEKGSMGIPFRSALEGEGYWGDWTIHSAPAPAHPSYRLIAALRLLHAFDRSDIRSPEVETVLETWRNAVNGYTECISPQNEDMWKQTLLRMCQRIVDRVHSQLAIISALDDRTDDGVNWQRWMEENVVALWVEERDVAEAVRQSIASGVEF